MINVLPVCWAQICSSNVAASVSGGQNWSRNCGTYTWYHRHGLDQGGLIELGLLLRVLHVDHVQEFQSVYWRIAEEQKRIRQHLCQWQPIKFPYVHTFFIMKIYKYENVV